MLLNDCARRVSDCVADFWLNLLKIPPGETVCHSIGSASSLSLSCLGRVIIKGTLSDRWQSRRHRSREQEQKREWDAHSAPHRNWRNFLTCHVELQVYLWHISATVTHALLISCQRPSQTPKVSLSGSANLLKHYVFLQKMCFYCSWYWWQGNEISMHFHALKYPCPLSVQSYHWTAAMWRKG